MGFLDKVLGRSQPAQPDLDALFAIPDAAITLEAAAGFRPTGLGSVAFRATEGGAFAEMERDLTALLDADAGPAVERMQESYGYTWLLVRHDPKDVAGLVTDLHAVNTSLEAQGFGPMLLCSLVSFADAAGRRLALVYLYKRGAFYPFAPTGGEKRDTALELQVRGTLGSDLRVEPDLGRWFPVWGAPGL
ncbi:MAG: PspA-associated protein PspAB [Solirubrobacteraceae bacterium]